MPFKSIFLNYFGLSFSIVQIEVSYLKMIKRQEPQHWRLGPKLSAIEPRVGFDQPSWKHFYEYHILIRSYLQKKPIPFSLSNCSMFIAKFQWITVLLLFRHYQAQRTTFEQVQQFQLFSISGPDGKKIKKEYIWHITLFLYSILLKTNILENIMKLLTLWM
jgi:hypothetical protein